MDLARSARLQEELLREPAEGVAAFLERPSMRAWRVWREYHLPLLFLVPLAAALAPVRFLPLFWGEEVSFSFLKMVLPIFLPLGWHVFAMGWDKILENRAVPDLKDEYYREKRNLMLYLALPTSGTALFFFLHPILGYVVTLFAIGLALLRGLDLACRFYGLNLKQSIYYFLSTVALFQVALVAVLFLYNLALTWRVAQFILDNYL